MKATLEIDSIKSATSIQAMAIKKMKRNYRMVEGGRKMEKTVWD
jgi:hypothetical protein